MDNGANHFGKGEGKLSGEIEDLSIDPDRSSIPSRGKSIYFVNQSQVWDIVLSPLVIFLKISSCLDTMVWCNIYVLIMGIWAFQNFGKLTLVEVLLRDPGH